MTTAAPRVTVTYCTQCNWLPGRLGWRRELLNTFGTDLGEVALIHRAPAASSGSRSATICCGTASATAVFPTSSRSSSACATWWRRSGTWVTRTALAATDRSVPPRAVGVHHQDRSVAEGAVRVHRQRARERLRGVDGIEGPDPFVSQRPIRSAARPLGRQANPYPGPEPVAGSTVDRSPASNLDPGRVTAPRRVEQTARSCAPTRRGPRAASRSVSSTTTPDHPGAQPCQPQAQQQPRRGAPRAHRGHHMRRLRHRAASTWRRELQGGLDVTEGPERRGSARRQEVGQAPAARVPQRTARAPPRSSAPSSG